METLKKYWWVILIIVIVIIVIIVYLKKKSVASGQPPKPPISVLPLTIVSAGYGASACTYKDVSSILAKLIKNNSIQVLKGSDSQFMNTLFGGDPCPGVHKQLQVVYTLGNDKYNYNIQDDQSILINI